MNKIHYVLGRKLCQVVSIYKFHTYVYAYQAELRYGGHIAIRLLYFLTIFVNASFFVNLCIRSHVLLNER